MVRLQRDGYIDLLYQSLVIVILDRVSQPHLEDNLVIRKAV